MSKGINKAIIVGRCGKDPEVKYLPSGQAVASMSVATSESWKDKDGRKQEKTEWHKVAAFGKLAEIIGQYVKKGGMVYVEGKLVTRQWEKDGQKHYTTEIVASEMQMLDGRSGVEQAPETGHERQMRKAGVDAPAQPPAFDDDIPF